VLDFNSHISHSDFLHYYELGFNKNCYITFLWSPALGTSEKKLGYKAWLDLVDLPTHMWTEKELAIIVSSFGLIISHTPLIYVPSLERLRLLVATDNLLRIPRNISILLWAQLHSASGSGGMDQGGKRSSTLHQHRRSTRKSQRNVHSL
jgi:hypothetical protein